MGKNKNRIHLSQCMIVKNEEKNIRKALSWGKEIVEEQIVVDTGSTDRTVEIAKSMGAKVFHFQWNDNFSAAKNYAIKKAKGNWIAFLDADESFSDQDTAKIIEILKEVDADFRIDIIRTKLVNFDDEGKIISSSCQDRIFRNDPKIRYHYRIHEELYSSRKKLGGYDAQELLTVLHTGYSQENKKGMEKGLRNARLLLKDLEENPEDPMRRMYLGDAYALAEQKEKAMECYREVLQRFSENQDKSKEMEDNFRMAVLRSGFQLMTLLSSRSSEEIQEEYFHICELLRAADRQSHPDIDYFLAIWYLKAGQIVNSAVHFERAMEKTSQYCGVDSVRFTANIELAMRTISQAALEKGELQKAVQFSVTTLRINKYSADALQVLLKAFLTEYHQEGIDSYWNVLDCIYDSGNLKDMLFLHKISEKVGFLELQERVLEYIPENVKRSLSFPTIKQ